MKTRISGLLRRIKFAGALLLVAGCAAGHLFAQAEETPAPVTQQVTINNPDGDTNLFTTLTNISEISLPTALTNLSPGMLEIIKLAQANVGEAMMLTFITNSFFAFAPTADEIVYLNDLGVTEKVIQALYEHGTKIRALAPMNAVAQGVQIVQTNSPDTNQVYSNVITPASPVVETDAQQVVYASAPAEPVTTTQFYSALTPYGTWMTVPEYGYVWQPTVVTYSPGWTPYSDRGHWVNTSYGWHWQSDYSWGWAPFHYGRWHRHHHRGWFWVPGHVWSPAWVSWRYSDRYCGWAPLPPEAHYSVGVGFSYYGSRVGSSFGFGLSYQHYTFVPTSRFHHRHLHQHRLHERNVAHIFHETAIHNNYHSGRGNFVHNYGIPVSRVSRAVGAPIPRVDVHEVRRFPGLHRERLNARDNALHVYRPITERTEANSPLRASLRRNDSPSSIYGRPTMPGGSRNSTLPTPPRAAIPSQRASTSKPWLPRTTEPPIARGVPVYNKPPSAPVTVSAPPSRTYQPVRSGNPIPRPGTFNVPTARARNEAPVPAPVTRQNVAPRSGNPIPRFNYEQRGGSVPASPAFTPAPPSRVQNNGQAGRIVPNRTITTRPTPPKAATPSVVTPYSPPARNYSPPARNYSPPVNNYSPPARNYSPPARNYSPPVKNYSPPARNYTPPARSVTPPPAAIPSRPAYRAPTPAPSAPARSFNPIPPSSRNSAPSAPPARSGRPGNRN